MSVLTKETLAAALAVLCVEADGLPMAMEPRYLIVDPLKVEYAVADRRQRRRMMRRRVLEIIEQEESR